jgi:flagellar hook-associated protein 2
MTVSASIGPISGIDYGTLLTGLTQLDQAPIDAANAQIATLGKETTAFNSLAADLTALKVDSSGLISGTAFNSAIANSSNPSVLTATAGIGTAVGSYNFTVDRLATSSQIISQGYADSTNTALGTAGNLTFDFGKGTLNSAQQLSNLNGGKGISAGSIRITDRSGATTTVNLSQAVDINDVVNSINSATGVSVTASLKNDQLVLTDNSGGTGTLSVANVGSSTTAADLGLTGAASGNTLTGTDINKLGLSTNLNALNDGNGIRTAGVVNDFAINSSTGPLNVSLNGAQTLGDVINKINAAGNVNGTQVVTAAISADGHGITLTDTGGGTPTVTELNGSQAAQDLGLTGTGSGGVLTGSRINSGLNSALLSDLNGGSGVGLGPIIITDRSGVTHAPIDLTGAKTVNDVINTINAANAGVTASLNSNGMGISLSDTTGSATGSITVANGATGTAATSLGLAQTVNGPTLSSGNLHLRYISNNTPLSSINGGAGFTAGQIQVTDSTGATATLDLTSAHTIGDVINKINQGGTGIKASVNAQGNGILLTDTTHGGAAANVQESGGGSTAASLNLLGTFTNGTLNGSFEKTVAIAATDTLSDVVQKINTANVGVAASIINDGSGTAPYRLSLTSRNSGAAGNINFDGSALGIQGTALSTGQDAVVRYGSGGSGSTLQITSSNNTITNLVPGLTINLASASSQPVTVGVSQDTSNIGTVLQTFVTDYNKIVADIGTDTAFDPNNPSAKGILFTDSTVEQLQNDLGHFIGQIYNTGSKVVTNLAAVGITLNQDGTLAFSSSTLQSILATNASDVQSFFTANTKTQVGVGQTLNNLLSKYTDSQTGLLFEATDNITTQTTQLNDRITYLNQVLTSKQQFYSQQFANLEVTISQLKSQGNAISSYTPVAISTSSSSSSG